MEKKIKLQIAVDMIMSDAAKAMADKIADIIDIFEVGTPMIMREGMLPVRIIKEAYPFMTVLADTKIVDGGEIESVDAFEAGADIVTVLAIADNETIKGTIKVAKRMNRLIMADMINVPDLTKRAYELEEMGVDIICVHTAVDVQHLGKDPYSDFALVKSVVKKTKLAIAGGIKMEAIRKLKGLVPDIVIVGGALTKQRDVRNAVIEMQTALNK